MLTLLRYLRQPLAAAMLLLIAAATTHAHFPWLATDEGGHALLYFGENPDDRAYKIPEALAGAKVFARDGKGERAEVNLSAVETDDYIGRRSSEPIAKDAALEMTCEYGLYHSMLLTYYSKHLPGNDVAAWSKSGAAKNLKLDVTPVASKDPEGVSLRVTWAGTPLAKAGVMLTDASSEMHEGETDKEGVVTFKKVAAGMAGVTASFVDDAKGEHNGEKYESAGNYATLTFQHGDAKGAVAAAAAKAAKAVGAGGLAALPEPVASFGAAVTDGYLYVYGGHIGEEHEHSKDNLSQHFRRISLDGDAWEDLPMQTPLQGLPLVAHGGKLYRVGGLNARNADGEDEDLMSVDEFACFDPANGEWTVLPPLPEPRSSHDAAVIGDTLYVVGGWKLSGSSKGEWLDTAWSFDLSNPKGEWRALPSSGFRRRALATAAWQDKLVVLGGMGEDHDISRRVDVFDPAKGEWQQLAELPGEGMDGFGVSAINADGKLFASGTQDALYQLSDDGKSWVAVLELELPRFFHRLLPGKAGTLLSVAGASEEGHLASIEELAPGRRPSIE